MKSHPTALQILTLIGMLAAAPLPQADADATPSPEEIMKKVDFMARKSFQTQLAKVKITTCKYTVTNDQVGCSERPRVVLADNAKKIAVTEDTYQSHSVTIVEEPIGDRGLSMLVYEYGERGRDNDNWLYLPALGKVNRVIANDDSGGSVFGSEFSVENIQNPEARKLFEYTYKILEDTTYRDHKVWVIEITPTPEKARKTSYQKVVTYIDQETYIPLKEDLYRNGKVHKQRTQSNIKKIDDVFVATKIVMNNLDSSRISQMDKTAMVHNRDVPDDFLSQRALTDFAFREQNLARFREYLN